MTRLSKLGSLLVLAALFFFSCQKELSQESNTNEASFSLQDDSTQQCYPVVTINGHYYNGVSADRDTNYVAIIVNVKTTGNYTISSSTNNGFYFSDSGFFSKTGLDTVFLQAKGTPILDTTTDFIFPSYATCGFTISVEDSTGTGLGGDTPGGTVTNGNSQTYVDDPAAEDGKWKFTDSTSDETYSGDVAAITLQSQFGLNVLSGTGTVTNNTNQVVNFTIALPSAEIQVGSYPLDGLTGTFTVADASNTSQPILYSIDGTTQYDAIDPAYINITSYDATTKRVKLSFRGWAEDADGNPVLLKGSFNGVLQ